MSLAKDAERNLEAESHLAGFRITIECNGTQIRIRGRVRTFYQKQLAQEAVRRAMNGHHLHQFWNDITVLGYSK